LEGNGSISADRTGACRKFAKIICGAGLFLSILAASRDLQSANEKGDSFEMQYLLLIYSPESHRESMPEPETKKIYQQYGELIADLRKDGKYLGGHELQPTTSATTVRVRNGKKAVTDGPFAETKEQLGGYFLVEAKDLDEAMSIAARIPTATAGSIEVRPVKINS
jgi:hypothetical protein